MYSKIKIKNILERHFKIMLNKVHCRNFRGDRLKSAVKKRHRSQKENSKMAHKKEIKIK